MLYEYRLIEIVGTVTGMLARAMYTVVRILWRILYFPHHNTVHSISPVVVVVIAGSSDRTIF